MPEIEPTGAPFPRAIILWDGTTWRVQACDGGGRGQVRGEDQLFSFHEPLDYYLQGNPSGANGYIESGAVPPGEIWVVTTVAARDQTRALTRIDFAVWHAGQALLFHGELRAFAAVEALYWGGHVYLEEGDTLRAWFLGSQAADVCNLYALGYKMTLEV